MRTTRRRAARAAAVGTTVLCAAGAVRAQAPLGQATTDSPVALESGTGFITLNLTKANDKTSPIIRLAYKSTVDAAAARSGDASPATEVHRVPFYAIEISGVPSNGTANLFGGGSVGAAAQAQLSLGQAYLFSWVTPRDVSAARANLAAFTALARSIAELKARIGEARAAEPPDTALARARRDTIRLRQESVRKRRAALAERLTETAQAPVRAALQAAIDYADRVLAYAASDTREQPAEPDPYAALRTRGGPIYDEWFARVGYGAATATLFDAGRPFGDQFEKRDYRGYSLQAGYSLRVGGRLPFIVAGSAGLSRNGNADDLSAVEVTETQTFRSADGATSRTTSRKRTGLVGEFKEETRTTGKLDLVFYPWLVDASSNRTSLKSTIAFDVFGRALRGAPVNYGAGAYVTKPGSPTSVYGGLNAYRAADKRLAIDLVAGFPF